MSKRQYDSEDDRDDDSWDEDSWEADSADNEFEDFDDSESETVPCPACGADVYEDAEMCPICGRYITTSSNPWQGKAFWWIVIGLAGIVAVIFTLLQFG